MALLVDDLDLDAILAPIPGANLAGMDPREDVSPNSNTVHLGIQAPYITGWAF